MFSRKLKPIKSIFILRLKIREIDDSDDYTDQDKSILKKFYKKKIRELKQSPG